MYFCPKCDYSFDISKSSGQDMNINKKVLETPEDVIKRIRAKKDLNNYIAGFDKEVLLKHPKFKKLSDEEKESINVLFNTITNFDGIEFKCLNCNFREPIKSSIKLYEMNQEDDNITIYKSKEENKLLSLNPILPRTKDYTCKNINCITHKDKNKKEAVFYKDKRTHSLIYICTTCYTNWG